jgi:hypothetical protein
MSDQQAPTAMRLHAARFGYPFPPLAGGSEQQPAATEDTPAVAGPEQAPGTAQEQPQDVDWKQRYDNLQPEYTRTTQRLTELESREQLFEIALTSEDPDTQRQALERLGFELPPEEDPEGPEPIYDDPVEELRAQQQQLEERLNQTDTSQREAAQFDYLSDYIDEQVEELGINQLDDATQEWILGRAMDMPVQQPPGSPVPAVPDVKGAFEAFQTWETERQRQWARGKRGAPTVVAGGRDATEAPTLALDATHEQRVAFAMQKLAENDQQQ